jgi:hypothetical protein
MPAPEAEPPVRRAIYCHATLDLHSTERSSHSRLFHTATPRTATTLDEGARNPLLTDAAARECLSPAPMAAPHDEWSCTGGLRGDGDARRVLICLSSMAGAALGGVLVAAPVASAGVPAQLHLESSSSTLKSSHWAGYVAEDTQNPSYDFFKYVTATFSVPAVTSWAHIYSRDVSQYAGLSGYWEPGGSPLQAAGAYETCSGTGAAAYYASYWNVPANGTSDNEPGQPDGPHTGLLGPAW